MVKIEIFRDVTPCSLADRYQLSENRSSMFLPNCIATHPRTLLYNYSMQLTFQHFYGRSRNCYSLAIRAVHRALVFATKGRKLKKEDMAAVGSLLQMHAY